MRENKTIGIEITQNRISVAVLSQNDGRITLLKAASLPMREGILDDGNVANPSALAKAVRDICLANKISGGNAVVSVPVKPSILRIMQLPKNFAGNVNHYIAAELKHYALFANKKVYQDFCTLPADKNSSTPRILLAACEESRLKKIADCLDRAGINVTAIEPAQLACLRLYQKDFDSLPDTANLAAIIGDANTTFCVYLNGYLEFIHSTQIAGQSLNEPDGKEAFLNQINIIKQHFDVQSPSIRNWRITAICIGEPISQELLQNADIHIKDCKAIVDEMELAPACESIASPVSIGLAMRDAERISRIPSLNLLPANAVMVHTLQKLALIVPAASIIAFLMAFAVMPMLGAKTRLACASIADLKIKQQSACTRETILETGDAEKQAEMIGTKLAELKKVTASAATVWPELLFDLSDRMSKEVRIESLSAKKDQLDIKGQALSYDALNTFIKSLQAWKFVKSAKLSKSKIESQNIILYVVECRLNHKDNADAE